MLTMWLSAKCSECGRVGLLLGRRVDCARCESCIAGGIVAIRPETVDLLARAFRAERERGS